MDIKQQLKELRVSAGMTQKEFAENLGIPVGTVRNWEQGIAAPADYIYEMISRIMEMDDMINWGTVKLIDLMNRLCRMNTGKFIPFSEAKPEQNPMAFPHDENEVGILYDDEEPVDLGYGYVLYRAIMDCCLDEIHHDIISYWDSEYEDQFNIGVVVDTRDTENKNLELRFKNRKNALADMGVDLSSDGWRVF